MESFVIFGTLYSSTVGKFCNSCRDGKNSYVPKLPPHCPQLGLQTQRTGLSGDRGHADLLSLLQ